MDTNLFFGLVSGAVWGSFVAWSIRHTDAGRLLATYLMWLVVSIGVGVDLLIALLLFAQDGWVHFGSLVALFGISAVPLALASINEHLLPMLRALMDGYKNESTK
jgi:hypothetical protein